MTPEKPLSEKIGEWDGGEWLVIVSLFHYAIGHGIPGVKPVKRLVYEIGIQYTGERKITDNVHFFSHDSWTRQSVQEVANAIAHLLGCGEFYTPEWCMEHFK